MMIHKNQLLYFQRALILKYIIYLINFENIEINIFKALYKALSIILKYLLHHHNKIMP